MVGVRTGPTASVKLEPLDDRSRDRVDVTVENGAHPGAIDGADGAPPHRILVEVLDEQRMTDGGGETVHGGLHIDRLRHELPPPPFHKVAALFRQV